MNKDLNSEEPKIQRQLETIITESIYTEDEAIKEAKEIAQKKLQENNKKIKKINKVYIIKKDITSNMIKLKLFISVNEDITSSKNIDIIK